MDGTLLYSMKEFEDEGCDFDFSCFRLFHWF